MGARGLLVALIVVATAAFVVGTAIERTSSAEASHHDAAPVAAEANESHGEAGGEAKSAKPTQHSSEASGETATRPELRPLGIDVEAWPFVALAAIVSLVLATTAWFRPTLAPLLGLLALAMLVFAALDAREFFHQFDVDEHGLAILAAAIALLHLGAAAVAAHMASRAARPTAAGAMPA